MQNILIIYPHWPPSNLAGVHRPRLIANFANNFNWHPIILTVHEDFYEENPDPDLCRLVKNEVEVIKVRAFPVFKIGFRIGDIGLRGGYFLYKRALKILQDRKIDFIWIPIPAWYTALVGRALHEKTGIPYGIDYIDPWVSKLASYNKFPSKPWLVNKIARILEPIAIKKVSLITGVSTPYYMPVIERNFKSKYVQHVGMPYGFDPDDHTVVVDGLEPPWAPGTKALVYAGAFLPQSHYFIKILFSVIKQFVDEGLWDKQYKIYFLGTGNYQGVSITEYARQYDIDSIVVEINTRFQFLHILNFLHRSSGVLVIGSTEKHYTASKIFQALLSKRPVFSMLHFESSAVQILQNSKADQFTVKYIEDMPEDILREQTVEKLLNWIQGKIDWNPDLDKLDAYSAKASAALLFSNINSVISKVK